MRHLQLAGQLGPEDSWVLLGDLSGVGLRRIAQKWTGREHGKQLGLTCVFHCVIQTHPKHHHHDDLGEKEVQTGGQARQGEVHRTVSHIRAGRHRFGKGFLC